MTTRRPAKKRNPSTRARKDRLLQTRVAADLESTLKEEAERRRLSVSHLIRTVLEDTFHLVDDVVSDLDKVVSGSVDLARNVRRNARRLAAPTSPDDHVAEGWDDDLDDVYGWNELVLQRTAQCRRCDSRLERGSSAFLGLTDQPRRVRVWLCKRCIDTL